MNQEVKRINDPEQLRQIINKLFLRQSVTLKNKDEMLPVKLIGYDNGLLEISHQAPDSETRFIFLKHSQHNMFLECSVKEKKDSSEIVHPVKLHLHRQIRSEKRIEVPESEGKIIWVTDVLTLKNFPEIFSSQNNKRDALIKAYKEQLLKKFKKVEIVFRLTVRLDYRMRTLNALRIPIYIPDHPNQTRFDETRFVPYSEYAKLSQYDKLPSGIISEVTEPMFFKNRMLLGYVRAMSETTISLEDYEMIHRVAKELLGNLKTYNILPINRERCPVMDVNLHGMGFMHPHVPHIIKNFMPGEQVIFDIHFPKSKTVTFMGVIKNMKSLEKAHRLGIQFENMMPDQTDALQEFLAGIADAKINENGAKDQFEAGG